MTQTQSSVLRGNDLGEKKIVFLISSSPFSTLNNYEALRTSLSLFDHQVSVIWRDEATHFTKNTVDKTMTKAILRLAEDMEIELFVVKDELIKLGIDENMVETQIKTINNDTLVSIIASADVVMNF
jgi:sulfur relay (sulfurtransferase) DsrF/TusC family protein